jgi:hypothetical protein
VIRGQKSAKKGFQPLGDRPVELQLALCLQQNLDKGGGGAKKFTRGSTFFSWISAGSLLISKRRLIGAKLQLAL